MSATRRDRRDMLPVDLRARVLDAVARTPAPTRREHRSRAAIVSGVGALATVMVFFATGGFSMGERPLELVAFTAFSGLALALVLTSVSMGGGSMLGRSPRVLLLACVAATPLLAIVTLAASTIWSGPAAEKVPPEMHVACGLATLVHGPLLLVALMLPRRGSDPLHPAITGAALGVTVGAWAAMMASLRCPHAAPLHCISAHVIPTLVFVVAGALLGRSLLKIR